jgi:hypothetical protein
VDEKVERESERERAGERERERERESLASVSGVEKVEEHMWQRNEHMW